MTNRYTDLSRNRTPNHRFTGWISAIEGEEIARAEVIRKHSDKSVIVSRNVYIDYFHDLTAGLYGAVFDAKVYDSTETYIKGEIFVHYGTRDNAHVNSATECELICLEFGVGDVNLQADDVIVITTDFRPHSLIPSMSTGAAYTQEPELSAYQPQNTPSGHIFAGDFNGARPQVKVNAKINATDDVDNPVPLADYNNLIVAWVDPDFSVDGTVSISFDVQTDDRSTYDDITDVTLSSPRVVNPYTLVTNWRNVDTVVEGSGSEATNPASGLIGEFDNKYRATDDSKEYEIGAFTFSGYGGDLDETQINGYKTFKFSAGVHHIIYTYTYVNNDSLPWYTLYDGDTYTDSTERRENGAVIVTVLVYDVENLPASGMLNISADLDTGWKADIDVYDFGGIPRTAFKGNNRIIVWGDEHYGYNDNYLNSDITFDGNGQPIVNGSDKLAFQPQGAYIKFNGYIDSREETMTSEGNTATYSCVDVIGYLAKLQGFGNAFISPSSDSAQYGLNFQVANNSVVKQAIILLSWYTNTLMLHPLEIDSNTINVAQTETILQEGSILEQLRYILSANDNTISSTRTGILKIHPNLLYVLNGNRNDIDKTATPTELHTGMVIDVKVNVLDYSPVAYVQFSGLVEGGVNAIRSTYPNNSSIGEGTRVVTRSDLVVFSQDELNQKVAIAGALETNQVYDAVNEEMLPAVSIEVTLFGGMDIFDRFNEYFVLSDAVTDAIITPNGIDLSRYYFVPQTISVEFEDGTSTVTLGLRSAPFMIHGSEMTTAIETATSSTFESSYSGYDATSALLGSASLIEGQGVALSTVVAEYIDFGYHTFSGAITAIGLLAADGSDVYLYTTDNFADFSSNINWTRTDITSEFSGEIPFKVIRNPYSNNQMWILTNKGIHTLSVTEYTTPVYTFDTIVTWANSETYKNIAFNKSNPIYVYVQRYNGTNAEIGYLENTGGSWTYTDTTTYSISYDSVYTAGIDSSFRLGSDPYWAINRNVYAGDVDSLGVSPTIDSNFSGLGTGLNYNALTLVPDGNNTNEMVVAVASNVTDESTLYRRKYGSDSVSEDITLASHYVPTYLSRIAIAPTEPKRFLVPFVRSSDDKIALYFTSNSGTSWSQSTDYIAAGSKLWGEVLGQFNNELFAYGDNGVLMYSPNLGGTYTNKAIGLIEQHASISDETILGFLARS